MTDKSRSGDHSAGDSAPERLVIRDKRKIDTPRGRHASPAKPPVPEPEPAEAEVEEQAEEQSVEQPRPGKHAGSGKHAEPGPDDKEEKKPAVKVEEKPSSDAKERPAEKAGGLGAELQALRADLDERTRDLQRITAEYSNYRKRVDRDRGVAAEQTTGTVLGALLPVLDDLDRARDHGDLVGPFGAVAEQLTAALGKFGLTAFGEKGDPFDPTRHEAVAHRTSSEVSEPTCVEVMRRGYLLGERLLRPALVAVADPE